MNRICLILILSVATAIAGPRGSFDALSIAATTSYAAASGATDKLPLCIWGAYTRQWGLWPHMVCWPLRSSQNAGTGSTAYSFGGLGTYNGTLVNGPTWGAMGVSADGIDDAITLSDITGGSGPYTIFSVSRTAVGAGPAGMPMSMGWSRGAYIRADMGVSGWATDVSNFGNQFASVSNLVFNAISFSGAPSGFRSYANGENFFAELTHDYSDRLPGNGSYVQLCALRYSSGVPIENPFGGDLAMATLFTEELTAGQHTTLYYLYKQTLGKGLGLP